MTRGGINQADQRLAGRKEPDLSLLDWAGGRAVPPSIVTRDAGSTGEEGRDDVVPDQDFPAETQPVHR